MRIKKLQEKTKVLILELARKGFKFQLDRFPTIISNDCFGGEVYQSLGIPYNSPFIGLMLMAPCYINLLKNLDHYMSQDLVFIRKSKYKKINKLQSKIGQFPIATIGGDVEIQFLHYHSEQEAYEKWTKRKERIDKENLFVKFDYSKDFANERLLNDFLSLGFKRFLAIGSTQNRAVIFDNNRIDFPKYATDASVLFRISLRYIDYEGLFKTNRVEKPSFFKGLFLSKFLNNSWGNEISTNEKIDVPAKK